MGLRWIHESGVFEWPWPTEHGLAIITGAAGGGGGGGGAICIEGLNLYGSDGGDGGGGGKATVVTVGERTFRAAGGNGGGGGNGGSLIDGRATTVADAIGCHYGVGGNGGRGAVVSPSPTRKVSNGGNGGKGFPGATLIVELSDLSIGAAFEVTVGVGGSGGRGGGGFREGGAGSDGPHGSVLLVPIFDGETEA